MAVRARQVSSALAPEDHKGGIRRSKQVLMTAKPSEELNQLPLATSNLSLGVDGLIARRERKTYSVVALMSIAANVLLGATAIGLAIAYVHRVNNTPGSESGSSSAGKQYGNAIFSSLSATDAILIIDVQNDFMPTRTFNPTESLRHKQDASKLKDNKLIDGSLPVASAENIVSKINPLIESFEKANGTLIYSLDWHPEGHCSHASASEKPFTNPTDPARICKDETSVGQFANGRKLMLWPAHCVQGTWGAQFDPHLIVSKSDTSYIIKKGFEKHRDSYSALTGRQSSFIPKENNIQVDISTDDKIHLSTRRVADIVRENKIKRLFLVGIATDYCVANSVLDALFLRVEMPELEVYVVESAIAAVDPKSTPRLIALWKDNGANIVEA